MSSSGLIKNNDRQMVALDGLWQSVDSAPAQEKLAAALEYAGCEFHDNDRRFLHNYTVSLAGLGGIPIAHAGEDIDAIEGRIDNFAQGSRTMMASSAAFSYLNIGEKPLDDLYETVTGLGHFSIAHTVSANFLIAGITQATELELSLQRDVVHISKVTNTRTSIQNQPPIVVRNRQHLEAARLAYDAAAQAAETLREIDSTPDALEVANGYFPLNKASILLISGDLSDLKKFTKLAEDIGKEVELREVAQHINDQLSLIWPEIFKGEATS